MRRKAQGGVGGALSWIYVSIKRVTATLQVADMEIQGYIHVQHTHIAAEMHKLEEDPDTKSTTEH